MSGHPYGHRSDPHREASNSTGRSKCEPLAPKSTPHLERMVGNSGAPSPLGQGEGPRRRRRNWAYAVGGLPGVAEDGMPRRNRQRKHGTARGSPRRSRTAKASRITGSAGKSRRACERGGWGRVSDDGPGHYNPDRSEGPWGRAANAARTAVFDRAEVRDSERGVPAATASTKGGGKPGAAKGMPGAGLTGAIPGKAPSDRPAFQPYWGKPAVRNERGGGGNVGIIRSPVRATTLPDRSLAIVHSAHPTTSSSRNVIRPSGQPGWPSFSPNSASERSMAAHSLPRLGGLHHRYVWREAA